MKQLAMAVVVLAIAAPTVGRAASYWALKADHTTLSMTDLRSPRLTGTMAETFVIVVNRTPTKAAKGKLAAYSIDKVDLDCAKGKARRDYTASYTAGAAFITSQIVPKPWAKIAPGSNEETLLALACRAVPPKAGFLIGDHRVGEVMATYRTGGYDRFIH